ncbi:Nitrogen regulation protein NR(II) [Marinomonas gallaica]|uniref:Sensory histidine kinase/phosphatase NtrB n=1 Tax=Marinomonas gallaica TaxID=1806667 RepID=A0A1C3JVK6_9GAMM|nr:nitrogen regulation protein NR(II) [Marinomonas gallaica]SBT19238.1 Nitrogen regulation protein NR(II) [Marinomonas gallaica]SBT20927.1 Nitrogen regulation protein NR(II) [Marinomonas gallaica]
MYSLLIDHLSTAVLQLNRELCIEYLNPSAEMMLEVSRRRIYGQDLAAAFNEDDESRHALLAAIQSGHAFTKREAEVTLTTGKMILCDYNVTPVMGALNNTDSLLIELHPRDRMKRISQEDELIANHQTSKELIRGLAHEIKNPLGGIRGAAQLISRVFNDEGLKDYTQVIIEESDRLRDLVDRLLGPRQLPQYKPLNIHRVIERVNQLISVESEDQIKLIRDYDPSIPDIIGDEAQLIQAVLNVMRNAMQALIQQPDNLQKQITVSTRTLRQFTIGAKRHRLVCRLSIVDNGPGIPENILKTLFYPMVSGRADGTGLGLSIAQSVIHQHNGIIECNSQPQRTEFNILIPIENSAVG